MSVYKSNKTFEDFVSINYHNMTLEELANHLNLTKGKVRGIASFLKLSKNKPKEKIAEGDICSNILVLSISKNRCKLENKPLWICKCLKCDSLFERRTSSLISAKNKKYNSACEKCSIKYSTSKSHRKTFLYQGTTYNSSWELVICVYLNFLGIKFKYEPEIFKIKVDEKNCKYIPDFYLLEYDFWLEVKGNINQFGSKKFDVFSKTNKSRLITRDEIKPLFPKSIDTWARRITKGDLTSEQLAEQIIFNLNPNKVNHFKSLIGKIK